MQTLSINYEAYQATSFSARYLVRSFHHWNAWAAIYQAQPVLLLDEYVRRCVTVCVYDTEAEREKDIAVLRTMPDAPPIPPSSGGGSVPPATPSAAALYLPLPPPSKRRN